jgi:hypothetical protein
MEGMPKGVSGNVLTEEERLEAQETVRALRAYFPTHAALAKALNVSRPAVDK